MLLPACLLHLIVRYLHVVLLMAVAVVLFTPPRQALTSGAAVD